MIDPNILALIFFVPFIIILILFRRASLTYFRLYREKKNPDFPLVQEDITNHLNKNPYKLIKKIPLTPFFMWKIVLFEHQKDKQLNQLVKKVRMLLFLSIALLLVYFFSFILLAYFNVL